MQFRIERCLPGLRFRGLHKIEIEQTLKNIAQTQYWRTLAFIGKERMRMGNGHFRRLFSRLECWFRQNSFSMTFEPT
jgi:hypothetical protein